MVQWWSIPEKDQHLRDQLVNSDKIFASVLQAQNKLIMEAPVESMMQESLAEVLKTLPPLGLKLHTESCMDMIQEKSHYKKRSKLATEITHNDVEQNGLENRFIFAEKLLDHEALKASKISALFLQIGSWQRVSKNEEDVVAKFYFAKRRLLWEIMENGLKRKIEIRWENVLSMRVFIEDNQPGILEVELSHPPSFFLETEPEPRKHSRWKNIADFTDGQATICRRHFLKFPPRALKKHWEKLLQFEPRFLQMCHSPFPLLQDPYFHSNLHYDTGNISFQQQPCSSDPMSLSHIQGHQNQVYQTICTKPSFHFDDFSPTSVMDLSDELIPYNGVESTPNNYADYMVQGDMMIRGLLSTALPTTSQESPIISHRNNNLQSNYDEQWLHNPLSPMSVYSGNQRPNYSNMDFNAIVALSNSTGYGDQRVVNENIGCQFHAQNMSWAAPEEYNLVHTNFGSDQAWKDIADNQDWINPWN